MDKATEKHFLQCIFCILFSIRNAWRINACIWAISSYWLCKSCSHTCLRAGFTILLLWLFYKKKYFITGQHKLQPILTSCSDAVTEMLSVSFFAQQVVWLEH